jgi:hypothetical protein
VQPNETTLFREGQSVIFKNTQISSSGAGQFVFRDINSDDLVKIAMNGDDDTYDLHVSGPNGLLVDSAQVVFGGTGSLQLHSGTTAQRPTGVAGLLRYNSDNSLFEGYQSEWVNFSTYNGTNLSAVNYDFNIDQTVGTSQDNYAMGYNDTSGEIELRPGGLSTRGQLIETTLTSLGTLSTSYAHVKSLISQNLSNFTATDSTLTYTGTETILVELNYSGNVFFDVSTSGTYNVSFLPYINSTQYLEAESTAQMTADASEDWIFPFSGTTILSLSTNDVISLRRKGSSTLTSSLNRLSLTVKAL